MTSKELAKIIVLLLGLLSIAAGAGARDYRPSPWHLADVWWTLEGDVEMTEFSIDIEFENELGSDVRIFVAPAGLLTINETKAYGGFQTRAVVDDRRTEGKLIIFSRWGERRREYIWPEPDGLWESAGYEGDFISVRKGYSWQAGRYSVTLSKLEGAEPDPDNAWVRFRVCFYADGACASAGALKFPGRNLKLNRKFASFVEIYGPAIDPDRIPTGSIVIGNVRVNGERARLHSATAFYPKDVPPYARVRAVGLDSVRIEIGARENKSHLPANSLGTRYQQLLGTAPPPVERQRRLP